MSDPELHALARYGFSRDLVAIIFAPMSALPPDSVAKLWLRLRLDRDSVDQHCDSRGAVDDGAARVRTRSILLQV